MRHPLGHGRTLHAEPPTAASLRRVGHARRLQLPVVKGVLGDAAPSTAVAPLHTEPNAGGNGSITPPLPAARLAAVPLLLTAGLWLVTGAPAHAQEGAGAGEPEPLGLLGQVAELLRDPNGWIAGSLVQAVVALLSWLAGVLRDALGRLCCESLNFITRTPPDLSYASPTVQGLWGVVRAIANAALALVALWAGLNLVVKDHLGAPYHEALEVFPRLVLGALLANTSLWWGRLAIDANNALCAALGQASLPAWESADQVDQAVVAVLAALIYLVMGLVLLLQQLARLALVDVLLVVAPLGLLCWVLPQTAGWARLWSSSFAAAVFTQFVQAVALKVGSSLIADFSVPAADAAVISLFLGVAVLALTLKIPGLLHGRTGQGFDLLRHYVYGRAAGAARSARTGGGGGGRSGAAVAGGAP